MTDFLLSERWIFRIGIMEKAVACEWFLEIISLTKLALIFIFLLYLIWSLYSYLHDWFLQVALLLTNEAKCKKRTSHSSSNIVCYISLLLSWNIYSGSSLT
ncbi:hypothetical protein HN51_007333 [Arachis hypogaea]|nr:uncharacterized protein DS421_5g145630 [Arachis hypogaea]